MAADMRSTCQATARLLKILDLADKAGSVTTWFKTRQSGLRAARSKNEHSYGERVVSESSWCTMVGLAISVGAAGNVHGRGSGALRLRSRDRVHLVYGRGDPLPPYRIHFYLQICSDLWVCTSCVLTNHRIGLHLWPLLVLTILPRGETSTQVIRFVLIHTFNIYTT